MGKGDCFFFYTGLRQLSFARLWHKYFKNVMLLETCHTMISMAESKLKYGNCHDTCPCCTSRFTIPLTLRELIKLVDEHGSHTLIFTRSQ